MDVRFHLQPHLDRIVRDGRDARIPAPLERGCAAVAAWQEQHRDLVRRLLGLDRHSAVIPAAQLLETTPQPGYRQERWAIAIDEDVQINCYLLVPDLPPPYDPVLVLHGHSPSVQSVLGHFPDETTAATQRARNGHYAQLLAQAGFLVLALEQRGFGARISDGKGQTPDKPYTCRHISACYQAHGRTLLGERVWDAMRAIDVLLARPDVRPDRLACTGNSGGGTATLYLAVLDPRVRFSVPSCCFSSLAASNLSPHFAHCECNYVPGILLHLEYGDLAALIAPRPLLIVSGEHDIIFPVEPARQEFARTAAAYAALGAADRCQHHVHPEGHRHDLATTLAWLRRWLA